MARHIFRGAAITIAIAVLMAQTLVAQQKPMKPTAPGTAGDPAWQGRARMTDGRVFVTDGGFAIDAALAKVAKLPERELPSKVLEDYLKLPHKDECTLSDLKAAISGRTYTTPTGLAVSATYINYLRRILPGGAVRLRTGAALQPVIVLASGKAVGVLMPVKQ